MINFTMYIKSLNR